VDFLVEQQYLKKSKSHLQVIVLEKIAMLIGI